MPLKELTINNGQLTIEFGKARKAGKVRKPASINLYPVLGKKDKD